MDRFGVSFKRLLTLTLMDRISGLIALLQIGIVIFIFLTNFSRYGYLSIIALALSFVASWLVFRMMIGPKIPEWILTSIYSIGVQGAQCLSVLALCFAFGLSMHASDYILLFLVSSVVAMIPITIGGAGAREITFLFGAQYLQIQEEKAVAFAFLIYL
ncbi:MAG: flippase-like domain-containing protein, partial [Bacteroidota bacterium]|nr:flippase-like domain-containing protein [Bacteroidota bacterium]